MPHDASQGYLASLWSEARTVATSRWMILKALAAAAGLFLGLFVQKPQDAAQAWLQERIGWWMLWPVALFLFWVYAEAAHRTWKAERARAAGFSQELEKERVKRPPDREHYKGAVWMFERREAANGGYCHTCEQKGDGLPRLSLEPRPNENVHLVCPNSRFHYVELTKDEYAFALHMRIGGQC